jgi:hypothetical protein
MDSIELAGVTLELDSSGCAYVPSIHVMAVAIYGGLCAQRSFFDAEFDVLQPIRDARGRWQPKLVVVIGNSAADWAQLDLGGEFAVVEPLGARSRTVGPITFACATDLEIAGAVLIASQCGNSGGWLLKENTLLLPEIGSDQNSPDSIDPGWDFVPLGSRDIMST